MFSQCCPNWQQHGEHRLTLISFMMKSHVSLFLRPLKCNWFVTGLACGAERLLSSGQQYLLLPALCKVSVKPESRVDFSSHLSLLGGKALGSHSGWLCGAPGGAWRQEQGSEVGAPRGTALLSASVRRPSAEGPRGCRWAGRNVSMSMAKGRAPGPCSHP